MWSLPIKRSVGVVPFLVAAAWPVSVSAQVVQGRFIDDATGEPVASVTVELLLADAGDYAAATDVTDEQGRFVLRAPDSGTFLLRTARIGYQPVTTRLFELEAGEEPLEVEVRISAVAVPLEPLTIISDRAARPSVVHLEIAGYYERKEKYGPEGLGLGEFIEREEIRRYNPTRVSDALRMVRGVMVQGAGGNRQTITLRGHGGGGGRCYPQVYIDGAPSATGRDIDEMLSPWSLAAIEVYAGLSVPPEFWRDVRDVSSGGARYSPPCGAIALWTGYGAPESTEPEPKTVTDQALVAEATQLTLDLTFAAEFAKLGDTLQATLTISNLSNDRRSLCIVDSRYTVRGVTTRRDIVDEAEQGPCIRDILVAPRASQSWQDAVTFKEVLDQPGAVLIQKHIRLRYQPCPYGDRCEAQLRSDPRWLTLYPGGGGL